MKIFNWKEELNRKLFEQSFIWLHFLTQEQRKSNNFSLYGILEWFFPITTRLISVSVVSKTRSTRIDNNSIEEINKLKRTIEFWEFEISKKRKCFFLSRYSNWYFSLFTRCFCSSSKNANENLRLLDEASFEPIFFEPCIMSFMGRSSQEVTLILIYLNFKLMFPREYRLDLTRLFFSRNLVTCGNASWQNIVHISFASESWGQKSRNCL